MNDLNVDGYMTISVDKDNRLLYYKIFGYPKFSKIIRDGHDKILDIVEELENSEPIENIVADLLDAKILLNDDIKFIATVSYPRLAKRGVKNLAILVSENIHVKINVEKTLEYLGPDVFECVELFQDKETAKDWFKSIVSLKSEK